jgi:hypothetical protein
MESSPLSFLPVLILVKYVFVVVNSLRNKVSGCVRNLGQKKASLKEASASARTVRARCEQTPLAALNEPTLDNSER